MAQCRADMNHVWHCRGEGLTVPLVKSECNNICDLTELGFDFRRAGVRAAQLIRVSRDSWSSGLCLFLPTSGMISWIYRGACISRDFSVLWWLKYLPDVCEFYLIFHSHRAYWFMPGKNSEMYRMTEKGKVRFLVKFIEKKFFMNIDPNM